MSIAVSSGLIILISLAIMNKFSDGGEDIVV